MIDVGFKGVIWGYQAVLDDMTEGGRRRDRQHRVAVRRARDEQRHHVQRRQGGGRRRDPLGGGRVRPAQDSRQRDCARTDADRRRKSRRHRGGLGAPPRARADRAPRDDRKTSPMPRCFSQATRPASSPATCCSSTEASPTRFRRAKTTPRATRLGIRTTNDIQSGRKIMIKSMVGRLRRCCLWRRRPASTRRTRRAFPATSSRSAS